MMKFHRFVHRVAERWVQDGLSADGFIARIVGKR